MVPDGRRVDDVRPPPTGGRRAVPDSTLLRGRTQRAATHKGERPEQEHHWLRATHRSKRSFRAAIRRPAGGVAGLGHGWDGRKVSPFPSQTRSHARADRRFQPVSPWANAIFRQSGDRSSQCLAPTPLSPRANAIFRPSGDHAGELLNGGLWQQPELLDDELLQPTPATRTIRPTKGTIRPTKAFAPLPFLEVYVQPGRP